MNPICIEFLGKKDSPTDAIEEYCRYLGAALNFHGIEVQIQSLPWDIRGWRDSLDSFRDQANSWRNVWVLVQYTALAWSTRGFPQKVLRVLKILKSSGARVGIVFHDALPYPGTRPIDFLRRFVQIRTMRRALALADLGILTVPPQQLFWLKALPSNAAFVPVGPNIPIPAVMCSPSNSIPTISVFSVTGGDAGVHEVRLILSAVRHAVAKVGRLRLKVFGRHAEQHEDELRKGLHDLPVELSVEGVIEAAQVVERLATSDVLLFVRGHISSRRGSAIAGIACGLPVIAFPGPETDAAITDAGLILVSPDRPEELQAALVRVLSDSAYRLELRSRSQTAYQNHFSWDAIAARVNALLKMN